MLSVRFLNQVSTFNNYNFPVFTCPAHNIVFKFLSSPSYTFQTLCSYFYKSDQEQKVIIVPPLRCYTVPKQNLFHCISLHLHSSFYNKSRNSQNFTRMYFQWLLVQLPTEHFSSCKNFMSLETLTTYELPPKIIY